MGGTERVIRLDEEPADEVEGPKRVVIVDDYPLMRKVIRLACESNPHLEVVGETGSGEEAVEMCARLQPHLVTLDVDIEGISGVEVARRLRELCPNTRILMLTGSDNPSVVFECMRLNVEGYIDKFTPFETLAHIVEQVASGHRVVSSKAERQASSQLGAFVKRQRETSHANTVLTDRERSVLDMIALAMTTTQMANRLELSERTIESHVAKLYRKLGVRTRTAALQKGTELGLVHEVKAVTHA